MIPVRRCLKQAGIFQMNKSSGVGRQAEIERILMKLVGIPSVTGTSGEARIAEFIHGRLSSLAYFQENPSLVRLITSTLPDIPVPLHAVFALVKAARPTRKTVLLVSHFDVVDVQNYGSLKHLAYDPPALIRALAGAALPPRAREDLESGNYLFGRGIMDMKLGLALEMDLVEEFSLDTGAFDVNIALLAVGDEENNNGGMRVGATFMKQACSEFDLDVACVVNTEPSDAGRPGAENQMIFLGTTGKLLPFFYVLGAGSHAGSYYQGLSASLLTSFLHTVIEANPALSDSNHGETTPPPLGLGLELRHREYSVTLPDKVATYFNYFFLQKTPSAILGEMTAMAAEAIRRTRDHIAGSYQSMKLKGYEGPDSEPGISVVTYDDLYQDARREFSGDLDRHLAEIARTMPGDLDVREKGIRLVEALLEMRKAETPVIVAGLLPPFLPPRTSLGSSPGEAVLQDAAEKLMAYAMAAHKTPMDKAVYFAGISDLSYVGSEFEPAELAAVARNTPGWGEIYTIPFEDIMALDAPVINIGPMGRDAHKMTERLEKDYALTVLPDLVRFFIRQV